MTFGTRTTEPIAYQEPKEIKESNKLILRLIERLRQQAYVCGDYRKELHLKAKIHALRKIVRDLKQAQKYFENNYEHFNI